MTLIHVVDRHPNDFGVPLMVERPYWEPTAPGRRFPDHFDGSNLLVTDGHIQ
jgi:hypothetical protein